MKVQNLFFLKMLVLLFSAILKKFGGLISNVMSPIESKNPHPLSPLGVNCVEHNSSSEYLACDFTDHYSLYLGHQIVWLRNELPARYEIRGLFQKSMKAKMSLMSLGDLYQCIIRVT